MKSFEKLALGLLFITSSSLASSATSGLVYKSNNETFVLTRECVSEVRFNDEVSDSKVYYSTRTTLKNTKDCAQKLNAIVKNNVGGRLQVYFNSKLVMDSYIASEIRMEKGLRMAVRNPQLGKDIEKFYENKNQIQ